MITVKELKCTEMVCFHEELEHNPGDYQCETANIHATKEEVEKYCKNCTGTEIVKEGLK